MGAAIAAQSATIGGQADPARSTKDNSGGPLNGIWCPIPPNAGTVDTWYCLGYHHDGASPPTTTWVAFAKQYGGEASVTINGATFDLRGLVPGEWMLYTAFGDGNAANPWQVTYALSVFRGTSGALGDGSAYPVLYVGNGVAYKFTTSLGITTVTVFAIKDLPFVSTYDTLDTAVLPYDPLGINGGLTTDVHWNSPFGAPAGKGYAAFTLVVGSTPLVYTKNAWAPDGLGATGVQPPQSWFQSQGVNQEWGLPDQANLHCREISTNDELSASIPVVTVATGASFVFFVQAQPLDYLAGDLTGIAARLAAEGGTGFNGPSDGHPDVLAMRVRPQFIDQTNEAGGGIFLETNNS